MTPAERNLLLSVARQLVRDLRMVGQDVDADLLEKDILDAQSRNSMKTDQFSEKTDDRMELSENTD